MSSDDLWFLPRSNEVAANVEVPEVRLPTYDIGNLPTMSLPGFDVMFGN